MKNIRVIISILLLFLLESCTHNDALQDLFETNEPVTFKLSATTRSNIEENAVIRSLRFVVADRNGAIINISKQKISSDFSTVELEGLKEGTYTISFFASVKENTEELNIDNSISAINQVWVKSKASAQPLDYDLLFKKVEFSVERSQENEQHTITLERIVARTQLDLSFDNAYSERFIRKIEFKPNESFYSGFAADGSFSQPTTYDWLDITDGRGLFTLPVNGKVSGAIRITSVLSDGSDTQLVEEYKFTNLDVAAGKIGHIAVRFKHPEDNLGTIAIRECDYNSSNLRSILADNEDKSIYYDESQRSFFVTKPLQLALNSNKELQIRFYSATEVSNVKIWIRLPKVCSEYLYLGSMEKIKPFSECNFPMPVTQGARLFRTESGRLVTIPQLTELSESTYEMKLETEDPYLKKIAEIKPVWKVCFKSYGKDPELPFDEQTGATRAIRPVHCREACVIMTNLAYIFSMNDFRRIVEDDTATKAFENPLENDGVNYVDRTTIIPRYSRDHTYRVGLAVGGGIIGISDGGSMWCIDEWRMLNHYTAQHAANTFMHEMGHCNGYNHTSGMTYGPFCKWFGPYYVSLVMAKVLPTWDQSLLNSINNPNKYK